MHFKRLAVIGTGLIGGSFALALKQRELVECVVGVARSEKTRSKALELGIADEATPNAAEAVAGADLVYVATPVAAMRDVFETIAPVVAADALVTDAASTKSSVMQWAGDHLKGRCRFVGGHPMAGAEQSGPGAARSDLFEGSVYILTLAEWTDGDEVQTLQRLVTEIGARVVTCGAARHDRVLAATSHVPHLVASALAAALADLQLDEEQLRTYSGSGLRDTTRIAAGPIEVWRDILLDNGDNIEAALHTFEAAINRLREAISADDAGALVELLQRAAEMRRGLDRH